MIAFNLSYAERIRRQRQQGFGPLFMLEQYSRQAYDVFGKTLSVICGATVLIVVIGSIIVTIVAGLIGLWRITFNHHQQSTAPKIETVADNYIIPDSCGLWDVYCPGEPIPKVGIASFLDYQLPDTCATRDWPKNTILKVSANGQSVTCVVRDYGPQLAKHPDRIIDLNRNQFAQLESTRAGLVEVTVTEL
jgi:hypothetical protein